MTFIIHANSPNVIKLKGSKNNDTIGFTKAFIIENAIPEINIVTRPPEN